jgi:hypothetical protein
MNTYVQYSATWQTTDPVQGTWTEVGLLDANGNLWAHAMLGSFTVNVGEIATVQWLVDFIGD